MPGNASLQLTDSGTQERTLVLNGRLDAAGATQLWETARAAARDTNRRVTVDATGVEYCDGAGVALLIELQRGNSQPVEIRGLRPAYATLLAQFDGERLRPPDNTVAAVPPLAQIGRVVAKVWQEIYDQIAFFGEVGVKLVAALARPASIRWRDVWMIAERTGVDALPIVALIAFLMGVILAFQSAIPLRQYGGEIFVADLVGLSMLRELGPLMTAILLAGRTGAAFAAELGTMKVSDEINALETMGLDPIRFLVVPRLLATLLTAPLLTIFADLVGVFGGALTMQAFSIPMSTYFNEMAGSVDTGDFLSGWVKSFIFGGVIAGIGCMKGLATRNDPTAVGESTTKAVVASIILIVVLDGIFALLYFNLDI